MAPIRLGRHWTFALWLMRSPRWRGRIARTAPLTSSINPGSTIPASRPNRRVIGARRVVQRRRPFREGSATAGSHRPPGFHRNERQLAARHRVAHRDGTRRTADGGRNASWALSWAEQRAAGVQPIVLQAYFGGGFHHPDLRGTTVHDWPLNVFSDEDAAAQLSILRAIASSDLHNLVLRAVYRIVPAVTANPATPLAHGAKAT
jgi:hypothetical protein